MSDIDIVSQRACRAKSDKVQLYLCSLASSMASSLLLFLAFCGIAASAHEVNLYHRVFVPAVSPQGHPAILPPWVPRGTAEILSPRVAKYAPVSNLEKDLATYHSQARTQPLALYQVALELPGVPPNLWPFSSAKAVCSCIPVSLRPRENLQCLTIIDFLCVQVPPHRQDGRLDMDSCWR